jgi:hypothetical protein
MIEENRATTVRIRVLTLALVVTTLFVLGRPLVNVWRSYDAAVNGEHAEAELVDKDEDLGLTLAIRSDSTEALSCVAEASPAIIERAEPGDVFEVVLKPGKPGECYLESSLRLASVIMWAFAGMLVVSVALILALGFFLHRSYADVPALTTRFAAGPSQLSCASCGQPMRAGYVVPMGGIHWRDGGEAIGLPLVIGGLPGTVGWKGRPRLQAFRCQTCDVVTFKHGAAKA